MREGLRGVQGRAIIVDDVRVRATGRAKDLPKAGDITSDPGVFSDSRPTRLQQHLT